MSRSKLVVAKKPPENPVMVDSSDVAAEPVKKRQPNRSRLRYRRRRQRTWDTRGQVPHWQQGIVNPETDLPTVRRAIREEWDIPERIRTSLVTNCESIHETSDSEKVKLLAAKVILEANAQNLKREELELKRKQGNDPAPAVNVNVQVVNVDTLPLELRLQLLEQIRADERVV